MEVITIAERRMISKKIVESAKFIKMPATSQNLYFHLLVNANDDGVVEAFPVLNLIRANEDDLRVLVSKGFVMLLNEDLVSYIIDWREQNKLRADRKVDSIYKDLLIRINPGIELLEMQERSDTKSSRKSGRSKGSPWTAQYSVEEDSRGKDSTGECSQEQIVAQLGTETLTLDIFQKLSEEFSEDLIKAVVKRILDKPYMNCLNEKTIRLWCEEQKEYDRNHSVKKNHFHNFEQRQYDFAALEKVLLNR